MSPRPRAPGAPEGTVHATDLQVAGRGRLDRTWESPAGSGIAVSVLLRPDEIPAARWVWLPLLVGLAVDATVREFGVDCGLKWPNDVLVDDRKLAGILLERVDTPARCCGDHRGGPQRDAARGRAARRHGDVAAARRCDRDRPHDRAAGHCCAISRRSIERGRKPTATRQPASATRTSAAASRSAPAYAWRSPTTNRWRVRRPRSTSWDASSSTAGPSAREISPTSAERRDKIVTMTLPRKLMVDGEQTVATTRTHIKVLFIPFRDPAAGRAARRVRAGQGRR